ncbi:hypothetical protein C8J57DRAFT_1212441 [Mycena rebaudengoi]|nr:hypothetical protein C8J57DRAFT_1212441 [Mycena rebaudengoi]
MSTQLNHWVDPQTSTDYLYTWTNDEFLLPHKLDSDFAPLDRKSHEFDHMTLLRRSPSRFSAGFLRSIRSYSEYLCAALAMDDTPPNTPQRVRTSAQRQERDSRILDSPQYHCVPHPSAPLFPQGQVNAQAHQGDVFGGGPVSPRAPLQDRIAAVNAPREPGALAPRATPNTVADICERLAELNAPRPFNPVALPNQHMRGAAAVRVQQPFAAQGPQALQPHAPPAMSRAQIEVRLAQLNQAQPFQPVPQHRFIPGP